MIALELIVAFAFGAVIGSFLNVLSLRWNTGLGFGGRSMCMSCGTTLSWYELVPVLSYAVQRGRCLSCKSRISAQYPLVEAATGVIFALVVWRFGGLDALSILQTALYLAASSILVAIAAYDMKHKIIPDGLVYAFDVVALACAFVGGASLVHVPHLWTLAAGPLLAAPFALLWLASKGRWIGLGDAKLVLGIGWLLGLNGGANALILAFWSGAAVGVIWMLATRGRWQRRMEIPFGPFLILGAFFVLLSGAVVTDFRILAALF